MSADNLIHSDDYLRIYHYGHDAGRSIQHTIESKIIAELTSEIQRLKSGDFTEEEFQHLCHCIPESDRERFFQGCLDYQRQILGSAITDSCVPECPNSCK